MTVKISHLLTEDGDDLLKEDSSLLVLEPVEITSSTLVNLRVSPAPWYDRSWEYRIQLTLDKDKAGGATLTDFPIVITENHMPDAFWSNVRSDGADIVVCAADGTTKLKRELATFSVVDEKMELHVRIPRYSHTADTIIYLYFGNPAGAEANDIDTWDSDFAAVWHMNDSPADSTQILDSTVNGNTGTKGAGDRAPTEVDDVIGKGQSFDGVDDYIELPKAFDSVLTGNYTLLAVAKCVGENSDDRMYQNVFDMRGEREVTLEVNESPDLRIAHFVYDGTPYRAYGPSQFAYNMNYLIAATKSGTTQLAWKDGVSGIPVTSGEPHSGSASSRIGLLYTDSDSGGGNLRGAFRGTISEARISFTARSPEWIEATYNWLLDNSNCYSVGSPMTVEDTSYPRTFEVMREKLTSLIIAPLRERLILLARSFSTAIALTSNVGRTMAINRSVSASEVMSASIDRTISLARRLTASLLPISSITRTIQSMREFSFSSSLSSTVGRNIASVRRVVAQESLRVIGLTRGVGRTIKVSFALGSFVNRIFRKFGYKTMTMRHLSSRIKTFTLRHRE